jgi:hypothetical protein
MISKAWLVFRAAAFFLLQLFSNPGRRSAGRCCRGNLDIGSDEGSRAGLTRRSELPQLTSLKWRVGFGQGSAAARRFAHPYKAAD